MTKKKRIQVTLDSWLWFIIALLPFAVFAVLNFKNSSANFFQFIDGFQPFPFVKDILDSVTQTAFGGTFALNGFCAYMVSVELIHLLFDFIVFIPRLCHKFMEKFYQGE